MNRDKGYAKYPPPYLVWYRALPKVMRSYTSKPCELGYYTSSYAVGGSGGSYDTKRRRRDRVDHFRCFLLGGAVAVASEWCYSAE